jgi:hypothetical protein
MPKQKAQEKISNRESVQLARPVKFKDLLIAPQNLEIDLNRLDEELRREREERDERLLG